MPADSGTLAQHDTQVSSVVAHACMEFRLGHVKAKPQLL